MQKEEELEGIKTLNAISQLSSPTETSISVITPPKVSYQPAPVAHTTVLIPTVQVTLGILQQAKELSIPALWLQPGAEDAAVIEYVKENGLSDRVIYGGPCILVEGDGIRSLL
jgi:predicted CoA-binding protein